MLYSSSVQSFARKMGLRSDWGLKQLLDDAMGAVVVLQVLLSVTLGCVFNAMHLQRSSILSCSFAIFVK